MKFQPTEPRRSVLKFMPIGAAAVVAAILTLGTGPAMAQRGHVHVHPAPVHHVVVHREIGGGLYDSYAGGRQSYPNPDRQFIGPNNNVTD